MGSSGKEVAKVLGRRCWVPIIYYNIARIQVFRFL